MVLPRVPFRSAVRWAGHSNRQGKNSIQNIRQKQLWQRRGYANAGPKQGIHVDRSDLPWAIASAVITIPATIYLIQPQLKSSHGEDHAHEEHGTEHQEAGEENDKPTGDDEPGDVIPDLRKGEDGEEIDKNDGQAEDKEKEQSDEQSEESDNEAGEQQATSEASEDEDSKNVAHETDSPTQDEPAAAKTPGSSSTISGKQEGLSNTDTAHSTNIVHNPDKSKKGEGEPETAKLKGTVDPGRPQAENRPDPNQTGGNTG